MEPRFVTVPCFLLFWLVFIAKRWTTNIQVFIVKIGPMRLQEIHVLRLILVSSSNQKSIIESFVAKDYS